LNLELRHFRLVQAIAEEGTVTAASRRLHLTQSALSHQLKDVEDRLGVPLFLRLRKKMILTPAGGKLLGSARSILDEVLRVEEEVSHLGGETEGVLRIATECYTAYSWLPAVLDGFKKKHPGVQVRVVAEATGRPVEALLGGKLDLAIVSSELEDPRLSATRLFEDELVLIASRDHPLASRRFVRASDFVSETLLVYTSLEESLLYRALLAPAGVRPRSVAQVQLTEAMVSMVQAGIGIAVLARWAVAPYLRARHLKAIPLRRPGLRRVWSAVQLKSPSTPAYIAEFVARLGSQLPTRAPY
jgi:LysR family transcriptional regulator, regulator for metE and metH